MSEVEQIFSVRRRVTAIARETRIPVGTVWQWKKNGAIPPWRRPAVLDAVRRLDIEVSAETLAYLTKSA